MLTYRTATLMDMPKVAELLVFVWRSCYQSFLPATLLDSLSVEHQTRRQETIFHKSANYYLCENEDKELLGFCSFGAPRSNDLSTEIELYTLYVHPLQQRKGIGKALLEKVQVHASDAISVIVMEENPFLSFYLKNGFKKQSQLDLDLSTSSVKAHVYVRGHYF